MRRPRSELSIVPPPVAESAGVHGPRNDRVARRDIIQASTLQKIDGLIARYGASASEICAVFGVSLEDTEVHGRYISCSGFINLLEYCAERFDAPFFGFELSQVQSFNMLGALGLLIQAAATVREAFQYLIKYESIHSPLTDIVLSDQPDGLTEIVIVNRAPGMNYRRQALEHAVGMLVQLLRKLTGQNVRPHHISIVAERPTVDLGALRKVLGCDLLYKQSRSYIAVNTHDLDSAVATSNAFLKSIIADYLDRLMESDNESLKERIDRLIVRLLPVGRCTLQICAWHLGLAPRTLQENLAQVGQEFSQLVLDRRRLLAEEYLRDTRLPLSEVAAALGYSDQATFTRAFSRWAGNSPGQYRKRVTGSRQK